MAYLSSKNPYEEMIKSANTPAPVVNNVNQVNNVNPVNRVSTASVPTTLTAEELSKPPVNLPPADNTNLTDSTMAGYQKQRLNTTPELTTTVNERSGLTQTLKQQLARMVGLQGNRTQELSAQAGLPEQQKQLSDLTQQAINLNAQYESTKANLEGQGRGIPIQVLSSQQNRLAKQQAIEVGRVTALAQAIQGNISLAKQNIKDTVALEFSDAENQINGTLQLLDLNYQDMTDAEKRRADEQAQLWEQQKTVIADQKAEKENIYNLAIEAAKNGAPTSVSGAMIKANSIDEALGLSGNYLQSADTEIIDLGNRKVLIDTKTGEQIADLGEVDVASDLSTNDYKNWLLSGGLEGTGKTFNEYITESKPATQAQLTAAGYADRLINSASVIDDLESKFTSTSSYVGQLLPNWLKSGNRQMLEQAERDFINAKLRQESGAVISPSEFENARLQYFPQPGDTSEVLAQKKANRDTVINGMIRNAGSAYQGSNVTISDTEARKSISEIYNTDKSSQKMINDLFNQGKSPQDILQALGFNSVGGDTKTATLSKAASIPENIKGGQCGRFVNSLTGLGLGDSYQSKMAKMDKSIKTPQPGMVFVMPLKGELSKYGHTGLILAINNGIATVKDSNWNKDEKIKTHQIPVSKMTGFRMV